MSFFKYLCFEYLAVFALGMVVGSVMITVGYNDVSSLPPKSDVGVYLEEQYEADFGGDPEVVNISDSNYPSLYVAWLKVGSAEKKYYVSKDGMRIFAPRKVLLRKGSVVDDWNMTVKEYVESR